MICFSHEPLSYGHCTSFLWLTQEHIRQLGRQEQSLSPVVNIVTKVQMSVSD